MKSELNLAGSSSKMDRESKSVGSEAALVIQKKNIATSGNSRFKANKDHYKLKASTASLKITLRVCFRW